MRQAISRSLLAITVAAVAGACASVSEYHLAVNDPNYFRGFVSLEESEARVLFLRRSLIIADDQIAFVDLEGCRFRIGVNEFAVCRVAPGENFITGGHALIPVVADAGRWTCLSTVAGVGIARVDCVEIADRIPTARQVWTTQSRIESRIRREKPRPRRKNSRNRLRE